MQCLMFTCLTVTDRDSVMISDVFLVILASFSRLNEVIRLILDVVCLSPFAQHYSGLWYLVSVAE